MQFEAMQLKICEGCGYLWVRCSAVLNVYCGACIEKLAHYPLVGAEGRPGRKRKLTLATEGCGL